MAPPESLMADPAWRPSPKAKLLWAGSNAIGVVVLFIGLAIVMVADPDRLGWQLLAAAALVIVAVVAIVVVPMWRYAVHRWQITDEAVYTRVGWFTQESRVAPISRIQTVDTERGPLDRMLGLATVTVTTASSAGAVTITALDLPVAEQTVTRLAAIAARHRGDAT